MTEPIIKYEPIRFEIQSKNSCSVYALLRLLEKVLQMRGVDIHFNTESIVKRIRNDLGYKEGIAMNLNRVLRWFKENSVEGWSFKTTKILPSKSNLLSHLKNAPLLVHINTFEKWQDRLDKSWFYIVDDSINKSTHMPLFMGWGGKYFICQDSHYNHVCYLDERNMKDLIKSAYYLIPFKNVQA